MGEREITYGIDRRGNPAMLSNKESIAQRIINAIFMAPGNLPNIPVGLKVEDYLYEHSSSIQSADVFATLKKACGDDFMRDYVKSVECYVVPIQGNPSFLLSVDLTVDGDDDTMSLVLTKQNDTVKFNYTFLSEGVKKAYGMN